MDSLAKRIEYVRVKAGLNRTAFAKSLGVTPAHISAIEKGSSASDQFIKAVAARYGFSEEWLRTGEGDLPENNLHPDGEERGALGLFHEIVRSGDPAYRRAFMANLLACRAAIRERKKSEEFGSELAKLKADQGETTSEIKKLRQEIEALRAIVYGKARVVPYTGAERRIDPDRRTTTGASPDGIEHRSGLERRAGGSNNGPA